MDDAAVDNGAFDNAAFYNRAVACGAVACGAVACGAVDDAPVNNSAVNNSAVKHGAVNNGTVNKATVNNGTVNNGVVRVLVESRFAVTRRQNHAQPTRRLTLKSGAALNMPYVVNPRIALKVDIQSTSGNICYCELPTNQVVKLKFPKIIGKIQAPPRGQFSHGIPDKVTVITLNIQCGLHFLRIGKSWRIQQYEVIEFRLLVFLRL